jgi:two-component system response regulator YesN
VGVVLIVDDEPLVRVSLRSLVDWNRWGFTRTEEAANGEEALAFLQKHPETALVILDLVMPKMDGLELLRRLRDRGPMPQVIVLTAHDEFAMVREAFQLGAADYLLKSELEPQRLAPLLEAAARRARRFSGAADTAGHAVAMQQQALHLLLARDDLEHLRGDLRDRGIELGAALCLGLLTVRDFEVVSARYDASAPSSFPITIIAIIEQVLQRHESGGLHHYLLRVRDDEYVLVISFRECHAESRIRGVCASIAVEVSSALESYMNVSVEVAWSAVCEPGSGPGTASLYRALSAGRPRPSRLVERARERIREAFADSGLHLDSLATELGVTPNHLSALFAREAGRSFREYLATIRIEAAKRLLAGSSLRVWEVAEKVGFSSVEHFSRVFKKLTGVSPHLFAGGPRA